MLSCIIRAFNMFDEVLCQLGKTFYFSDMNGLDEDGCAFF